MKKLGKLSIKEEKVISNDELLNLRGGCTATYGYVQIDCIGGANSPYKIHNLVRIYN